MARKPIFGSFKPPKSLKTTRAKAEDQAAARNLAYESLLCEAISKRVRVLLRYDDDSMDRVFEPTAVYWTSKRKVCVSGTQIKNPERPMDDLEPHNFEIGKIARLSLTGVRFMVDPRFDRFDRKYANGIICSV